MLNISIETSFLVITREIVQNCPKTTTNCIIKDKNASKKLCIFVMEYLNQIYSLKSFV